MHASGRLTNNRGGGFNDVDMQTKAETQDRLFDTIPKGTTCNSAGVEVVPETHSHNYYYYYYNYYYCAWVHVAAESRGP